MYKIVKTGGDGHDINYREIILERAADVSDLPNSKSPLPNTAEIGSIAYHFKSGYGRNFRRIFRDIIERRIKTNGRQYS